jgi:hypothetical protein
VGALDEAVLGIGAAYAASGLALTAGSDLAGSGARSEA